MFFRRLVSRSSCDASVSAPPLPLLLLLSRHILHASTFTRVHAYAVLFGDRPLPPTHASSMVRDRTSFCCLSFVCVCVCACSLVCGGLSPSLYPTLLLHIHVRKPDEDAHCHLFGFKCLAHRSLSCTSAFFYSFLCILCFFFCCFSLSCFLLPLSGLVLIGVCLDGVVDA